MVLVVAVLVLFFALPLLFLMAFSRPRLDSPQPTLSATSPTWFPEEGAEGYLAVPGSEADGPVYPYSVIPGGVVSAEKLQTALRQDPVAAAHYRGFRSGSAHVIRLASDRQVYVSYRIGDHVYWSQKKISLHAGETLLTDGSNLARTRCGNRISEVPAEPTANSEPPTEVLNPPISPSLPFMSPENMPAPLWAENHTPFLIALSNGPQVPGTDGPFLPFFPGFPCCGGSPGHLPPLGPVPSPYLSPPGPPTTTPEPQSLELLVSGLLGFIFLRKFHRF